MAELAHNLLRLVISVAIEGVAACRTWEGPQTGKRQVFAPLSVAVFVMLPTHEDYPVWAARNDTGHWQVANETRRSMVCDVQICGVRVSPGDCLCR
jgi:hypothetical protein